MGLALDLVDCWVGHMSRKVVSENVSSGTVIYYCTSLASVDGDSSFR